MSSKFTLCAVSAVFLFAVDLNAKVVTQQTAESVAKNFAVSKGLSKDKVVSYRQADSAPAFRAQSIDQPAYHIFTDAENGSFIVVSGDDIARPILGYSFNSQDNGNDGIPPAMQDWLNDMEKQILQARKNGVQQSDEIALQWRAPEVGDVVKQLTTAKWNQGYPFNTQCPTQDGESCLTGCTSTAYAILMKYYKYPSGGRGVTQPYICPGSRVQVKSRDLNHQYDWDSMPLRFEGNWTQGQVDSVSQLMADIGAAIQADYSKDGTTAYNCKGAVFAHFDCNVGLSKKKEDYSVQDWNSMLKKTLDMERPVLYNASSSDSTYAHAFIIDGYTNQDYFCVNWGWGGHYDGAFALDAMDVADLDYNGSQIAYLDFQPASALPAVATVDDVECPSLEAAVGMAPANRQSTRITMLKDCTIDEVIVENGQNVILDLNGCTIQIESYGFFNRGELVITDQKKSGKLTVTKGNLAIVNNYGVMTVDPGIEFSNMMNLNGNGTDYRRCIWTGAGTKLHIKGGKFKSAGEVICAVGKLTIDDGVYESVGNAGVILNYSTAVKDTLIINGGTFTNKSTATEDNNYRRALWSTQGSSTLIKNGEFTCRYQVICTNGTLTIDNGTFNGIGNGSVISNYSKGDTLTINGGTFKNSSSRTQDQYDYRRALWSDQKTMTQIKGGQFISDNQVATFNGKAIIDAGSFEGTGTNTLGCYSNGNVTINDCKLAAPKMLLVNEGFSLKCYGGVYSQKVSNPYLGSGCKCISNTDSATASRYPYRVTNPANKVESVRQKIDTDELHYDLNGIIRSDNRTGLDIIRKSDGSTIKVIYR